MKREVQSNMIDTHTYIPDNLIAGSQMPIVDDKGTILAGQNLKRGALLGRVDANGKLKLVDSTASDGSQEVYAVLVEDTNSTDGDIETVVYLTGEFNEDAVSFSNSDTVEKHRKSARKVGIFLKPVMG